MGSPSLGQTVLVTAILSSWIPYLATEQYHPVGRTSWLYMGLRYLAICGLLVQTAKFFGCAMIKF